MNKTAIKNFAVWARRELIEKVSQKALQYGITEKKIEDADADSINGKLLTPSEKTQRKALINKIKNDGYQQIIEEIAYTWFNRFIALRFMEVNDYLPEHIRVFTNDNNEFKPQILTEAITIDLVGLDKKKVFAFKEANDDEGLYRYLIIAQCNALNEILPGIFQKINDYTEILFPDFLLRNDSIIEHLIKDIEKEEWKDAVQIIGWMYQYYNAEPKDKLINAKAQYKQNDIPFVTQLFTSDWLVKFIVDNSLGRFWKENHPQSRIHEFLNFYVQNQQNINDEEIANTKNLTPEDIKVIDPCSGSGHMLVYAFDILMIIYREFGYSDKDAARLILEKNIFGLEIDKRAAQLAYFSIVMKARQYDSRLFNVIEKSIKPKIYEITSSDFIDDNLINYIAQNDSKIKDEVLLLKQTFSEGKLLGSLIYSNYNYSLLEQRINDIYSQNTDDLFEQNSRTIILNNLLNLLNVSKILSQKYEIIITNPPYMSTKFMPDRLRAFVGEFYEKYKADLFSVFLVRCKDLCIKNGHLGFLTPYVWLFIQTYQELRNFIYDNYSFSSLVQLEINAFESACVPVGIFTFRNNTSNTPFECIRLADFKGIDVQPIKVLEAIKNKDCGFRYTAIQSKFKIIPGSPVAYWASDKMLNNFKNISIGELAKPRQGMATSDNNRFIRFWYEPSISNIFFNAHNSKEAKESNKKWFPYNKGGGYRKWYGNNEYVVNWKNDGEEIKDFARKLYGCESRTIKNMQFYFQDSITWTFIAITPGFRFCDYGFIFDVAGSSIFINKDIKIYTLGFLCSSVAKYMLSILNPTMNIQANDIKTLPLIINDKYKHDIEELVNSNIEISKIDWDLSETSWNFIKNPLLITNEHFIEKAFNFFINENNNRYNKLIQNEELINKKFIEIYNVPEVNYKVNDEEITLYKPEKSSIIKTFISYAVGCMFGRYSLDKEGLVYAGGVFDPSNYKTFEADKDAIIPICDDDSFNDDIVTRFVEFVSKVYGKDTLEENLRFIADALGGNGTSRDVIRNYFINGFYKDHVQTYQKRPIYWLFDSGKNNGLKCLVYIHRYSKDTIARIRTDYVHDRQGVYENRMEELNNKIKAASGAEKIKFSNQLKDTKAKAEELHKYEEKIHHLADQMIEIDLDDGVKHNYEIFKDVLAPLK